MMGRGKGATDRDDDLNDTSNNARYSDDNASSEGVQLEYSKLYVTSLPTGLALDGLLDLFRKFGRVEHSFFSRDPTKKFAIITFETAGEAKVAMMKLNRTEPLKLNIQFAYKKKPAERQWTDRQTERQFNSERNLDRSRSRDDSSSSVANRTTSKQPIMEDHIDGDGVDDESEDNEMFIDYNCNLHYNLETLKLKQLELKEKQLRCQERILLIQQAERMKNTSGPQTKRRILPNGQIVISNSYETSHDNDTGYTVGAGDSRKVPALEVCASRRCVACGAPAHAYCARCAVTPYCGERCQRRDWTDRHHTVCHNLAGLMNTDVAVPVTSAPRDDPVIPQTAPLRRPHSPVQTQTRSNDADKPNHKALAPGERRTPYQQRHRRDNRDKAEDRAVSSEEPQETSHQPRTQDRPKDQGRKPFQGQKEHCLQKERSQNQDRQRSSQGHRSQPDRTDDAALQSSRQPESKPKPAEQKPTPMPSPGTVRDVTPRHQITPASWLVEKLCIGATFLASVECGASECATTQPGYVCVTLHEHYGEVYGQLCDEFAERCARDASEHTPRVGETFAYLEPADGGWYRARCLTSASAALIDAARVVSHTAQRSRRLPAAYATIPEFCAVLRTARLELNANLRCTLVERMGDGFKVTLEDSETALPIGEGVVSRWTPQVEYPEPAEDVIDSPAPPKPAVSPGSVEAPRAPPPEVPRPDVVHNGGYVLLDVTSLRRACVKPCSPREAADFHAALQDTLLYGIDAVPLTTPPQKGQTVVAKFTDGLHYRAFVKRTNVSKNKYLIEYVEYGNEETTCIERLYPCPERLGLSARPPRASVITLSDRQPDRLTSSALTYVDNYKDNAIELTLMVPGGGKTAPSGTHAILINSKSGESVSKRIEELCTPHWKILEERGGDVLELECRMFDSLRFIPVPTSRPFVARVMPNVAHTLPDGFINGFEKGAPLADRLYGELEEQINEYCASKLCKQPYLPKIEELCVVRNPNSGRWVRGVVLEMVGGAGGGTARVLYVDYGDVVCAPVADLRKIPPEFIDPHPALANHLEIKGFPMSVTPAQVERALKLFNISEGGFGELEIDTCREKDDNMFEIESGALVAALTR